MWQTIDQVCERLPSRHRYVSHETLNEHITECEDMINEQPKKISVAIKDAIGLMESVETESAHIGVTRLQAHLEGVVCTEVCKHFNSHREL